MNKLSCRFDDVLGIVSKNSLNYVSSVFEAYAAGAVVILLKDGNDHSRVEQFNIIKIIDPAITYGWMKKVFDLPVSKSVAQISFTSGTESEPKGVVLTHESLANVTTRLNSVMEVDASIREYVGVPVNYSFGLGRCRAIVAAGGMFYIPENGFNPSEIRQMLLSNEINSISAVPSLWRILLAGKNIFGSETDRIRWIEIGSQYMSADEKNGLKKLFKNAIIVQHYGLTEASRTTLLRIDKVTEKQLDSVGRVYGDTSIAIAEDGRIRIKGGHVASQIIKCDELVDNTDNQGWLQTNDLGRIEDGFLFYLGRADDLINCGGVKLSPDAIETCIQSKCQIKAGVAVARHADPIYGDVVLVTYLETCLKEGLDQFKSCVYEVLADLGLANRSAVRFLEVPNFPVTDTGKVIRKDLSAIYERLSLESARRVSPSAVADPKSFPASLTTMQAEIEAIWSDVLNVRNVDIDSNFYDMGGNSLSALLAVIEMERKNISPLISKGMLQGLSIRQIASSMDAPTDAPKPTSHKRFSPVLHANMAINAVRGILALCVVFAHWSAGFIERLPVAASWIKAGLSPLLAIGTPGFSIIYGISAGYSLYPIYISNRDRFSNIQRKTLLLLTFGILLDGSISFIKTLSESGWVSITEFFNAFYSVLTYYWLITASVGFIFLGLEKSRRPISFGVLLAIIAYYMDQFILLPFASLQPGGALEFLKLLFTAKYAYFNMLSGSAIGLAIGIWLTRKGDNSNPYGVMLPLGVACILLGLLISFYASDLHSWLTWPISTNKIWRWITYVGVILLFVDVLYKIFAGYAEHTNAARYVLQFFVVCGMLAFPIFVLHEVVIPLKAILIALFSIKPSIALFMGFSFCFAPFVYIYRKIYNVSFS